MTNDNDNKDLKSYEAQLLRAKDELLKEGKASADKLTRDLIIVQNRLYAQLEGLSWLQRRLNIKGQLPPLRGWATSPDVLVRLHAHIMEEKPNVIVEFGSGASTLVIADALRQNKKGKLFSIEHSEHYGEQTLATLKAEGVEKWVDLRINELEPWSENHLNPTDAEKASFWYAKTALNGIKNVDLLWVDGPPAVTCKYSRFPALPALIDHLTPKAEVWMDDTIRQEEKDICQHWAESFGFDLAYFPLEKGLGRLTRTKPKSVGGVLESGLAVIDATKLFSEKSIGLNFSLPEE